MPHMNKKTTNEKKKFGSNKQLTVSKQKIKNSALSLLHSTNTISSKHPKSTDITSNSKKLFNQIQVKNVHSTYKFFLRNIKHLFLHEEIIWCQNCPCVKTTFSKAVDLMSELIN